MSTTTAPSVNNRENETLKKLLNEERQRSTQRKDNYHQLMDQHQKLQKDYLTLQLDQKATLEKTSVFKKLKEDELEEAQKKINQQDQLIEKLKRELDQRDPGLIEQQAIEKLREPYLKLEKEKDALLREIDRLKGDLKCRNQKIEYIEKEMKDSIDRVRLSYEAEVNLVRKEKEELRVKFLEITKTPEGQQIVKLTEEVEVLSSKLRNREKTLEEVIRQHAKITNTIGSLEEEREKILTEHERQIESLRNQLAASRETITKLNNFASHYRHEKDNLNREIKRLERDQARHQEQLSHMEKTCDQEKEQLRRSYVKERTDFEIERNGLLDEIKRLKVDLVMKDETIGRLEKTIETKEKEILNQVEISRHQESNEKSVLERERESAERRVNELNDEKTQLKHELANCKRALESNGELRMNLEKEVMLFKAKVESYQSFQEEIDRLRRNQANSMEELDKVRDELAITSAIKKDLTIQLQRSEEEYARIKSILEEERREVVEYKVESEKIISRLKNCLDEERGEMRIKFDQMTDELKKKHKEREEVKVKCKQYASLVDKLQSKVKSLEENVTELEKSIKEMVPLKVYKELKRQYKELKRLLNDLPTPSTSNLVNLSHQHQQHHHHQPPPPPPQLSSISLQHQSSNHCKVTKTREKQTTTST